jgi:hypothetical protein
VDQVKAYLDKTHMEIGKEQATFVRIAYPSEYAKIQSGLSALAEKGEAYASCAKHVQDLLAKYEGETSSLVAGSEESKLITAYKERDFQTIRNISQWY